MMDLRKLDALVAEHVFGWRSQYGIHLFPPADEPNRKRHENRDGETVIPHYSIDISAAWDVVEKMCAGGFSFSLNMSDVCEVEFNLNDGRFLSNADTVGFGRGESAPLAICLAALKAKGVDVSEWE